MSSIEEKSLPYNSHFQALTYDTIWAGSVSSLETVKDIKQIIYKYTVYGKLLTFISLRTY